MAFPPKDKAAPEASAELCEDCGKEPCECEASESTSNASPDKMKGSKMNPLRRWAATMADGSTEEGGDY